MSVRLAFAFANARFVFVNLCSGKSNLDFAEFFLEKNFPKQSLRFLNCDLSDNFQGFITLFG